MSINLNELAKEITLLEGKSESINIAQVKEMIAILGNRWRAMEMNEVIEEVNAIRDRAGTKATNDLL